MRLRDLLCLSALLPTLAFAGPLDEKAAEAHLAAIAGADIEQLMTAYDDSAVVEWIGGPLDGRYQGREAIREVWLKFFKNNDGQPREMHHTAFEQSANPKGATLLAKVDYRGKMPVKVRQILSFRDTKLVTEVWQIDPALNLAAQ